MLRDGVTADELEKARQGYLQAMKVGRPSDGALAGSLNGLRRLDRTMLWDADLEKRISPLTPEQVGAAMKRHIDPKKLVTVKVGDFAAEKQPTTLQQGSARLTSDRFTRTSSREKAASSMRARLLTALGASYFHRSRAG